MAKTELNTALKGISGSIDNWVYRRFGNRTVICGRPRRTAAPLSAAQENVREQFRLASGYADSVLADPALRAVYTAIAHAQGRRLRAVVMADFLNPPVVDAIDLAGYHGAIGDPIKVRASDNTGVMAVTVMLRAEDDSLIEQGPATLQAGLWEYQATTACAPGTPVSITATAVDRPGHTGSKLTIWS
jgi:hypothetical protein